MKALCGEMRKARLLVLTFVASVFFQNSCSDFAAAQEHKDLKYQYGQRRAAQQQKNQQAAQQAQRARQAQNQAVRKSIDKSAKQQRPSVWKSQRISHPGGKTLVIGSTMSHVRSYVSRKNRAAGTPKYANYGGVPQGLKIRIDQRAKQRGEVARSRAYKQARQRGRSHQQATRYGATLAKLTAKNYRESRYLKHNLAFIRWATNKGMKVRDIGYGSHAKSRSTFLQGERRQLFRLRLTKKSVHYKPAHNAKLARPVGADVKK